MKETDKSILYGILTGLIFSILFILIIKFKPDISGFVLILLILLAASATYAFYRNKYGKSPKTVNLYRNSILSMFESFTLMMAIIFVYVSYLSSPVPVPETVLIQVLSIIFVVWLIVFFVTWKHRNMKFKL